MAKRRVGRRIFRSLTSSARLSRAIRLRAVMPRERLLIVAGRWDEEPSTVFRHQQSTDADDEDNRR